MTRLSRWLVCAATMFGFVALIQVGSTQPVRAQSGCYYDYFWTCNDSAKKGVKHHVHKRVHSKAAKTHKPQKPKVTKQGT